MHLCTYRLTIRITALSFRRTLGLHFPAPYKEILWLMTKLGLSKFVVLAAPKTNFCSSREKYLKDKNTLYQDTGVVGSA